MIVDILKEHSIKKIVPPLHLFLLLNISFFFLMYSFSLSLFFSQFLPVSLFWHSSSLCLGCFLFYKSFFFILRKEWEKMLFFHSSFLFSIFRTSFVSSRFLFFPNSLWTFFLLLCLYLSFITFSHFPSSSHLLQNFYSFH